MDLASMGTSFPGWSLDEATKRILGTSNDPARAVDLLPFLESEHLIGYERDRRDGSMRRLSRMECRTSIHTAATAHCLRSRARHRNLVLFPTVCASDAPSVLNGRPLKDAMLKFVLGDPELTRWAEDAIAVDATMRNFIEQGHHYPSGWHEWGVTDGTLEESDGEYGDSPIGILLAENDWPQPEVRRARAIAHLRFGYLMMQLSSGAIEAVGDPRSGGSATILPSIWTHPDYYLDVEKGDLLLLNNNCVGRHDRFLTRWSAVMLREPRVTSFHEPAAPIRSSAKEEEENAASPGNPLQAEKACRLWLNGLMLENPTLKPKAKAAYREEAKTKWPRLSSRAFDNAWARAIEQSGAWAWARAGRPTEGRLSS